MKFGILSLSTDNGINAVELGQAVEELGFESLFIGEHTHIPVSRRTPYPIRGEMPEYYRRSLDPFVALAAIVPVTERLLLGTGVCIVTQHDPITLAKEVASLDYLSNGRMIFGIGAGWNLEEMENHGTDPDQRWNVMKERIEAMKEIWTKEEASYKGKFVNFDSIWSWPKPIKKPHPPVFVGGNGQNVLKRVVDYGDCWMPLGFMESPVQSGFKESISTLNQMAADAGRGPIPVTITGVRPDPKIIEKQIEAGADRVIFTIPPAPADEVLTMLKSRAEVAAHFA